MRSAPLFRSLSRGGEGSVKYFWISMGVIATAVAIVAGSTFATLEVLARVWNPVSEVHAGDLAGRWIGVSPAENAVEIFLDGKGHRAEVNHWPANLDCNVGRIDGPSDLGDIEWTPSSSFQADAFPPDGAPVLHLRSYEDESCPRSLRFTVEQNARSGDLRIVYQVGALDDDTLDQALIFTRDGSSGMPTEEGVRGTN